MVSVPETEPALTTLDGRYQVLERVATGGMGEVYRAHDAVLAREVAIKVLHRQLAADPGFIERFRREARSAAFLSHPNIVAVYDWGATDGIYFMVMEYVRGRNVRDLLHAYRKLEPAQAADVLAQVLAALGHAHEQGIVHRDVKPENVLVTRDGIAKVADFGLARAFAESRATQTGKVTGTVQYLAPEQIQGRAADPRTDLYALGVVAFELLTGRVPFSAETSLAIAYQHLRDRVPAPSTVVPTTPPELDAFVLRATEKEADARPSSAAEMRGELRAASSSFPPTEPLEELVRRLPGEEELGPERAPTVTISRARARLGRRRWRRRLVGALLVLAASTGLGYAVWTFAFPHYADVPSVLGLSPAQARSRLDGAGFTLATGRPVYSTTYGAGEVAEITPSPGAHVRSGTAVTIHVSKGPESVQAPSILRMTVAGARAALSKANLVLGRWSKVYTDHVPVGLIVAQHPPPKKTIPAGTRVRVDVSKGPAPVRIPNVSGSASAAVTLLKGLGLQVQQQQAYSDTVKAGDVIGVSPKPNTTAHRGDTVTLTVSKGARNFAMPDVKGMSVPAARAELQAKGLKVTVSVVPGSSGAKVVSTIPTAGTTVTAGDHATIYAG